MTILLGFVGLRFESMSTVVAAFKVWQREGGDWADHLIGAQMQALGCEAVLTLDKRASRQKTHRMIGL